MLSAGVLKNTGGADAGPSRELRSAAEHGSYWQAIEEALNILEQNLCVESFATLNMRYNNASLVLQDALKTKYTTERQWQTNSAFHSP